MGPEQKANKYRRISQATAVLMFVSAIFYGVLEVAVDWILGVGQILAFFVDIFSLMHFSFWFALCRIKLMSKKVVRRYWTSMLLGILPIPVIDVVLVPLAVFLTIKSTWQEDGGGGNSLLKSGTKKIIKRIRK